MTYICQGTVHSAGGYGQSESDRHNPIIAAVGHIAIILPDFAAGRPMPGRIGTRPRHCWARPYGAPPAPWWTGFIHILDAGLGGDVNDYHQVRVSAFDEADKPEVRFAETREQAAYQARKAAEREQALKSLRGYQEHERKSKDACGTAELMGMPVAVPFVGASAGAMTIAQSVRIASVQAPYLNICGSLAAPGQFRANLGTAADRIRIGNVKHPF